MSDGNEYTRHGQLLLTPGVQWIVEQAGAAWLVDLIASYQPYKRVKSEEFQVWRLVVRDDRTATVTMADGNTDTAIVTQAIPHTDYPEPVCKLYLVRDAGGRGTPAVLMVPCEY